MTDIFLEEIVDQDDLNLPHILLNHKIKVLRDYLKLNSIFICPPLFHLQFPTKVSLR
jgi:hypothetical protein